MNLVTINVDSIRIGQPLPFSLRDESGVLLANKGYVVENREELDLMIGRRSNLFIDVTESESYRRAYVGKLRDLVRDDIPLGQIADSQFSSFELASARDTTDTGEPDWLDLQAQTHAMLRDSNPASFRQRLDKLQAQLSRHARVNPDGTLFALIHLSSSEVRLYSATHAMLVSVMCSLAAREVLKWPAELEATLCKAALTMNIGMTELQDRLALQKQPPSPEQLRQIEQHATRSVILLEQLGVTDPCWLEAVLDHRTKTPGPLAGRVQGQRMARLIQRADIFAARLAPRTSRLPDSPASAMQASYFDENRQIDEAGAALIKAVGIYSPGSFVRLSTNEVAVVIKRGANTTTPRVAILINRSGMPTGELIVRDTSKPEFRIMAGMAYRDVKVKINLERLLALTKSPASDRPW
ncbi:HD-GYP domain-containing protein [Rhodoferax ferrireducens]|uniref:HD-GYP domain-containing protein n=1 Tax=Rhodoferax ferrireducens TaxID=192843 RepID=UPI000E0CF41A|nr:phosphohydrolase [Rhodoferax ferrireducens]